MSDRRYVIAFGDFLDLRVALAEPTNTGRLLTKAEAAENIIMQMDGVIEVAKKSRNRAYRILRAERKKSTAIQKGGEA